MKKKTVNMAPEKNPPKDSIAMKNIPYIYKEDILQSRFTLKLFNL